MKSKIVFLLYFLAVNIGIAQVTLIPDSNFEQALIDQNYDDVLDGSVLTSNIQNITFLNLTNDDNFNINENEIGLGITDLTGIKDFTSLVELWVQGNDLTSLDLEGLTTIEDIRAFYNDIENLNINGLTNLEIAGLDFNNIASIDLSSNTSLRIFDIANNNLLSLDIRGLGALTNMNIQNNPQLNCIQVEDTARATSLNNNTNFRRNGSTVFSANCPSIYTLIPDVNFEQSLLDQGIDNEGGIPNGRVLTSDISSITILDISNEGVNDLTGIEDFISIQDLNVSFNDLNALPLQNNTLQIIRANECNLSGKPISFINGGTILPNVTTLELQNNTIGNSGTINFTGVPNVSYLDVRYNNFNSIANLSQLTQLTNLNVAFCNLSTIDVSQNSLLDTLYIFGNNLTSLNTNSNSSLSLLLAGGNNINTVALNNNTLLTTLDLSENNLGSITLPETTTLEELNLFSNNLSSLDISGVDRNLITFNAIENLALTCIQVSDVNNANNQAGWQKDSGTSYSVDCSASTAFGVLASLTNAGNIPNYEITEGETFTLNFDADNNATNGTQYNPIIDFSINGNSNVTDFRFNGNETTIPNSPFTVSAINPDGSISVTAFDDGIEEGDEVYTITVTSSDTNLFTILEPSTFTLTVKDKGSLYTGPLSITTTLSNAGNGPYYEVEEGSTFNLNIDAENAANFGNSYQLEIEFSTYKIGSSNSTETPNFRVLQEEGDILLINNAQDNKFLFEILENQVDGSLEFIVVDDTFNENMEEVVITVKSTQANQTISIETFIIKINANDPLEVEVNLENAGNSGNYQVEEGTSFYLNANILGPTDEVFEFDIVDILSTAIKDEDYYYKSKLTIYNSNGPADLTAPFTIYLDSVTENTERIHFKLPAPDGNFTWTNADANGELQFEIDIIDKKISIAPEVTNLTIGLDGVYEIAEGNTIELSLNSLNVLDDARFSNLPLVYEVINNTAEQNLDFEISASDIISDQNQNIYINTVIDGIQEVDEVFELRFPKPQGNFEWENADTDGSISLLFRITNEDFTDTSTNYNVELIAEFEFIDDEGFLSYGERVLSLENGSYILMDNETLSLRIESENSNAISKGVRLEAIDNMDALRENTIENINGNHFFTYSLYKSLGFKVIQPNEADKTFQLNITPTTNNYNLSDPENSLIEYLETITLNITVQGTGQRVTQEIVAKVIGATENINDQDAIISEYLVQEKDTLTILLSSLKPNPNQGATYNMGFIINTATSTLSTDDYSLTITDSEGNDMGGSLNNFTVNNNADFDAKITIIFLEDNTPESTEELYFSLVPDVTFDGVGGVTDFRTKLSGVEGPDQKEYRIKVSEPGASSAVYAVLSNTGSTEGTNEPDIITCSLYNIDNIPFTDHTSAIEIPFNFVEYDGGEALRLLEDEFNPDQDQFVFAPGQSQASINVLYDAEEDVNDIDCDYYYIDLQESNSSIANNVVISKLNYLVKVADLSEFLVFVDLDITDPRKIRPVVRNRHPNDDYNQGGELDLRKTIDAYEVEENTSLNFTIDAAKPVAAGKTYLLNMMFNEPSTAKFQSDFTFNNGDKTTNLPLVVIKDEIDYEVGFLIEPDQIIEPIEEFTISFQEPKYEKLYRYSKKDSRSYDQSYKFKIIESLPISITSNTTESINEELPLESTGEFLINIDRSSEREANTLEIEFELTGDAQFNGPQADYIIESENKFIMITSNSGILYINENDTEVKLRVTPINDDLVEGEETVTVKLIDAFGYYLNVYEASSLTIVDEDKADFNAFFKNEINTLFENRDSTYEDELIFTLDAINTTNEEIKIEFTIGQGEGTATFDEDYKLYYINEENTRVPITNIENFFISIPIDAQEGKLVIEVLEDGFYDETDEQITIAIKESEDYLIEEPNINTIVIRNEGEDGTSTVAIYAEVISSSCEDNEQGRIKLTNLSSYTFEASISNETGILADKTTTLPPTIGTNSNGATFKNLAPGSYTVFIEYTGSDPLPENYIPPSFELTIRTPTDPIIVASAIDNTLGMAKLQVKGSSRYEVKRNGELFTYQTGTTNLTTIEIPLVNGLNKLELKGDADCLQAIEQTLYLDSLKPYPNPTQNTLYIGGFYAVDSAIISIAAVSGKTIIEDQPIAIQNGVLEIDISELAIGLYVANVKMPSGSVLALKIVKK